MPNLYVFRPADAIETAECWQMALGARQEPSVLALSRQAVPNSRKTGRREQQRQGRLCAERARRGARRHVDCDRLGSRQSPSKPRDAGQGGNPRGRRVDAVVRIVPRTTGRLRYEVLGQAPRVAIEAGVAQGWHEWLRQVGHIHRHARFGASAPAPKLYEHFGITAAHRWRRAGRRQNA